MADQENCPKCGEPLPPDVTPGHCPKCLMQVAFESEAPPLSGPATASSGQASQTWNLDQLASLFPELEIIDQVGTGGMGVVYKAKQKQLDRLVAVKLVRPDLCDDPSFAERFTREARAMARLSHPAIINVFDFGQRENFYFFIMEFVDGANLRQLVRSGELDSKAALAVVPQICEALQYAHDAGIVHRDIKPENILLDKSGRVKIADFGLAKLVKPQPDDFTLTGTKQVVGTPHYMAPEQFEHPTEVDHRADIYSVGVVIYEMLTGELPLGRFAAPSEKVQVDVRLDEIVLRALEKEPELRYQQVTEIKTGLEGVPASATVASSAQPAVSKSVVDDEAPEGSIHIDLKDFRWPAWGLIATAAVDVVSFSIALLATTFSPRPEEAGLFAALHIVGFFIYVGAREMQRRGSYRWAVAAAVLAMLPFHWGVLIGIPFGVWSLILLLKPEAKSQFQEQEGFAPEIQGARDFTVSASRTAGQKLKAVPWTSVFGRAVMGAARQFGRLTSTGVRLGIWTLICSLSFAICMLLAVQHASWTFEVDDRSAQRIRGEAGQFDLRATGSQSHIGTAFDLSKAARDVLTIKFRPHTSRLAKAFERTLIIDLREMEWRISNAPDSVIRPFDADTILDWMKTIEVDTTNPTVQLESEVLNNLVFELAKDRSQGVRSNRSIANILRRDIDVFSLERTSSRYGMMIHESPDVVPIATACAANAILWLSGLAIIFVGVFRRKGSDTEARPKSRLLVFVTTATILGLWTGVGVVARPIVAILVPRALSAEFPTNFTLHDPSAAFLGDLGLCVVWTIGVLTITLPAWVIWRNRNPRLIATQSIPNKTTSVAETPEPTLPEQSPTPEPPDKDRGSM